jgi:ribulose kinase
MARASIETHLVAGLTLRHNGAYIFRAAYEGIAFGIRHILDLFDESATPGDSDGGGRRRRELAIVDLDRH